MEVNGMEGKRGEELMIKRRVVVKRAGWRRGGIERVESFLDIEL